MEESSLPERVSGRKQWQRVLRGEGSFKKERCVEHPIAKEQV